MLVIAPCRFKKALVYIMSITEKLRSPRFLPKVGEQSCASFGLGCALARHEANEKSTRLATALHSTETDVPKSWFFQCMGWTTGMCVHDRRGFSLISTTSSCRGGVCRNFPRQPLLLHHFPESQCGQTATKRNIVAIEAVRLGRTLIAFGFGSCLSHHESTTNPLDLDPLFSVQFLSREGSLSEYETCSWKLQTCSCSQNLFLYTKFGFVN